MVKGMLIHELLRQDDANYPLDGKISPTFQNEGETTVFVHGRKLLPGESYIVNQPGIVLTGHIPIAFVPEAGKSQVLYVGFIKLV